MREIILSLAILLGTVAALGLRLTRAKEQTHPSQISNR